MTKFFRTGCTALSLAAFCAAAQAAPALAASASISAHAPAILANLPYTLAKMQNDITVLQAQVKALQNSTTQNDYAPPFVWSDDGSAYMPQS